jgi:pyruvate/2-oxoacid:ferredoxin oxidoreductase alpha subunit
MKQVVTGNYAVSWGGRLARAQVIAAYPITPQTSIIEKLASFCAGGEMDARFIKVESEHSAMAACIGASAAGARAFTATSGQGLLLMHELVHWAAGARLPIVMGVVNRAVAPGWSIWTEQNDTLSQRDTGWMQFYCETNQEVLDTTIQAVKIAEMVSLPAMVVLDAFVLSHTSEPVDIPDQEDVDEFLPPYHPELKLDLDDPRAFGALVLPGEYMEMRYKMQKAMERATSVVEEIDHEWGERFGRSWGLVESYRLDGAEIALVTSGTVTGTSRVVVDELRDEGMQIGLLKVRMFRPFPHEKVRQALAGAKKVAVIDRNISFGYSGIFAQEVRAALYGAEKRPPVFDFVAGLGGRDIVPATIHDIVDYTVAHDTPTEEFTWIGVKR